MKIATRGWRWLAIALLALIAPVYGQQPSPLPSALTPFVSVNAPIVALTHVRVADGTGAPSQADQTIVLEGALIRSIGPFASTTIPAGALPRATR